MLVLWVFIYLFMQFPIICVIALEKEWICRLTLRSAFRWTQPGALPWKKHCRLGTSPVRKGCVQPPDWDEEEVLPAAQLFQLSRDSPALAAVRSLLVLCIAHIAQQVPTNKSGSVTSELRGCHGHDWKLSSCLACRAWLGWESTTTLHTDAATGTWSTLVCKLSQWVGFHGRTPLLHPLEELLTWCKRDKERVP